MEHQETKLTSMRPRLKELNDNPYFKPLPPPCTKSRVFSISATLLNEKLVLP